MSLNKILLLITLFVLTSCGGISVINKGEVKDYYSDTFLQKIEVIKKDYKLGNEESALTTLKALSDETLNPAERAMKRNLIGVIYFGQGNFEQAIYNFNLALSTSKLDPALTAQVQLNLASTFYKLTYLDKALDTLNDCEFKNLNPKEAKKYHKLKYNIAKELDREVLAMDSLVWYLSDKKTLAELKAESLFESLVVQYFKQSDRERLRYLQKFTDDNIFLVGYLSYLEAEKIYYKGKRNEAIDLLNWMEDNFEDYQELEILAEGFKNRVENYAKMNHYSIGVVLPLTGKKQRFGKRALSGIDAAFREFFPAGPEGQSYSLHILDSKGSAAVGAHKVKELVEKHQVSTIIGGLFSDEAQKEYFEAKRHGVFFVSLSQIYINKEMKDHLLVEIPGSVESLVNRLFQKDMLDHFGRSAAIIYPNSDSGNAYMNEFWRKAKENNVNVVGAYKYDKKSTDHRQTVQKLLGLKFKRERQEELETFEEIYSLEKSKSIRRIQVLKPQKNFEWVFVPGVPKEALQIIPSFSYYDAFNMDLIGGPSWRSKTLSRESYKLGKLNFLGDNIKKVPSEFNAKFTELYGKRPLLIEVRAYDSMKLAHSLLKKGPFESRDGFDQVIRESSEVKGLSGAWKLDDGIWVKNLVPLKLHRGKVSELTLTSKIENEEVKE